MLMLRNKGKLQKRESQIASDKARFGRGKYSLALCSLVSCFILMFGLRLSVNFALNALLTSKAKVCYGYCVVSEEVFQSGKDSSIVLLS